MTGLRIRHASPADRASVAALLRGLSPESTYRRFQTALGPGPTAAMLDALLPEAPRGGAVLAHAGSALVGHGVWHRAGTRSIAEIGVVVADDRQRQGIGTALVDVLVADLAARGIERLEVFATATNDAVSRMVGVRAPEARGEYDGPTVTYRLPVPPTVVSAVA